MKRKRDIIREELESRHIRDGLNRENMLVYLFQNLGEIIRVFRMKKQLRIQDVCQMVKEKYGEKIHPTMLSRYETGKLQMKNLHAAYIFDVLDIHLEDVFPNHVVIVDFRFLVTNLKFQYLVRNLRKFLTDEEIKDMILKTLEARVQFAWRVMDVYKEYLSKQEPEAAEEDSKKTSNQDTNPDQK